MSVFKFDNGGYSAYVESRITDYSSMVFTCDINEFDPNTILKVLKDKCGEFIREWLTKKFSEINIDKFEGGFNNWWGMGSVTMFELGLSFNFHYQGDEVVVEIM